MIPPVSPFGLIQETLWPNEWRILVACMMLNLTTRRSAEKILPKLFNRYPSAQAMASADIDSLTQIIAPLGFKTEEQRTSLICLASTLKANGHMQVNYPASVSMGRPPGTYSSWAPCRFKFLVTVR